MTVNKDRNPGSGVKPKPEGAWGCNHLLFEFYESLTFSFSRDFVSRMLFTIAVELHDQVGAIPAYVVLT